MSTTKTAQDHAITLDHPVIRVFSVGNSGVDTAWLNDCDPEFGFTWESLTGTVRDDGSWEWDGDDEITDERGNTVLNVWIRNDEAEYERQREEWEASA